VTAGCGAPQVTPNLDFTEARGLWYDRARNRSIRNMRRLLRRLLWLGLVMGVVCCREVSLAGPIQSASVIDPSQTPPAGGSGDSIGPIISEDGRYVLFASAANNLVLTASNTPLPVLIPPKLNVFLRDRTNQTTTLVSVNLAGTGGGNGDSLPMAISTNGQYVLFESTASNLVAAANNGFAQVFLRNLASNATVLVSVTSNGSPANGLCRSSVMTPDGRYVAFTSEANNLVAFDTNGIADVFVRDLQSGTTTLASVGASNAPSLAGSIGLPTSSSEWPDITPDGRYVAFTSTATNLVRGVATAGDIYIRDLIGGNTVWASTGARPLIQSLFGTVNSNIVCQNHAISADGQYVAYEARPIPGSGKSSFGVVLRYNVQSAGTDVVNTNAGVSAQLYDDPGDLTMTPDGQFVALVGNTNVASTPGTCIFVWSAQTATTTLASINLSNSASAGVICDWPVVDPTGQYVAFQSTATDLTTNSMPSGFHLYARDLLAGTTTLVDADTDGVGTGVGPDAEPSLSTNGPSIAFQSPDGNLVPNDRNRALDVFGRNVAAGTNEMISACEPALSSQTPDGLSTMTLLSVNSNGRYIAFTSDADNLVPNDTNGWRDVFVRDLLLGTNILVSVATNGGVGNDESFGPSITGDGRYVAFASSASNLVEGDLNNSQDVFVRDLQGGTTILASVNTNGLSGNRDSYSAISSSNGSYVLFRSHATDLVPGASYFSGSENLFLRDLQGNATYALTTNGVISAFATPSGRYVLFSEAINAAFYVWDTQSKMPVYTNTTSGTPVASADGNMIVYLGTNKLALLNRALNLTHIIASGSYVYGGTSLSSDGHWLAYATTAPVLGSDINQTSDIYLFDMVVGTNNLVSHRYASQAASGTSDSPAISSDGRFVAYQSLATNLAPSAISGVKNIYIYDQTTASNTLVTASQFGNMAANNQSMTPIWSRRTRTLTAMFLPTLWLRIWSIGPSSRKSSPGAGRARRPLSRGPRCLERHTRPNTKTMLRMPFGRT
jgi:hypothetical protein